MTQQSLNDIQDTIKLIKATILAYESSAKIAADREIEYKKARAEAWGGLDASLKNKEAREAKVMEITEEQYRLFAKWEVAADIERERLRSLRDILSAQQSINSSLDRSNNGGN